MFRQFTKPQRVRCNIIIYLWGVKMKSEKFKLTAFDIDSIGYFKKKKNADTGSYELEHYKGDINTTLVSLSKWVNSEEMIVANTLTIKPNSETESTVKNVYCYSLIEYMGNYLLTTWNETENTDNKITTLRIDQKVGDAQSGSTSFKKEEKPGFPSYTWFLPDRNMFVTINRSGGASSVKPMCNYIKNFLKYCNPDMVRKIPQNLFTNEYNIIYDNDPTLKLQIIFNYSNRKRKNLLKYVIDNIDKIKRVHSSNTLIRTVKTDEDIFEMILKWLGLGSPKDKSPVKCSFSIEYEPDEEQIKRLFQNPDNSDDRIGVDINGKTYWNKDVNFNTEINADEFLEDGKIANCKKLLEYLVKNKETLLSEYE